MSYLGLTFETLFPQNNRDSLCMISFSVVSFLIVGPQFSGARRLRDAIILGYQLQRAPGRDVCIPDWYANAENELGLRVGLPAIEMNDDSSLMNSWDFSFSWHFLMLSYPKHPIHTSVDIFMFLSLDVPKTLRFFMEILWAFQIQWIS